MLICFPKNKATDRILLDKTVKKFLNLSRLPDKTTLKLRHSNMLRFDESNKLPKIIFPYFSAHFSSFSPCDVSTLPPSTHGKKACLDIIAGSNQPILLNYRFLSTPEI